MESSQFLNSILPAELITEILWRLPVKFLLKFMCVSKSWLALISSAEFIKTHLNLSSNKEDAHHLLILDAIGERKWILKKCPVTSLFNYSVTEAVELDYPVGNPNPGHYLMGCCNGLVFLGHDFIEYSLIWNPTIRKHKTLPLYRPRWKKYYPTYGFGYDEFHQDYKVVVVVYNYFIGSPDDIEVKVYSLKNDSWTSVDYCGESFFNKEGVGYNGDSLSYRGFFVSGKLHWGTNISDPDPTMRKGRYIVSFDLADEKWEKVEKPSYGVGKTELCVGMLGTHLSVFCDLERTHLGAWVMKEYGVKESWIKMFNIRYPPNDYDWYPPFFMSNKGEVLSASESIFMIYNSKDDSFRRSNVTNCHDILFARFYFESLVWPFSTEETENAAKERQEKLKIETIEEQITCKREK